MITFVGPSCSILAIKCPEPGFRPNLLTLINAGVLLLKILRFD